MKAHASLTLPSPLPENLCVVSPRLQLRAKINHSVTPLALLFLNRNASFRRFPASLKVAVGAVRFDGPVVDVAELEDEDCEVVVEMCITRTLQPAVTLETGIQRIKDAVEALKLNPPSSSSGVFRFQVAVPPSPKALIWFCSQPESSGVFPQFFVSNDTNNLSCKSLFLNGTRGVFGIGAAIYFVRSNSSVLCKQSSVRSLSAGISPVIQSF
uniref:Protein PHYLLOic n=1 Tax=Rhizophora mucronata TaxID=61149 RepID=A0A2P2MWF5_RHIMU